MGIKRATPKDVPDLITIYRTPYPVLSNYKKLMNDLQLEPYAGGSHVKQGPSWEPGYITSGYRDESPSSPHGFAIALDIAIGDIHLQYKAAIAALKYFNRVGLYPNNGIIHVDLFNDILMAHYNKIHRFWVRKNNIYTKFHDLAKAYEFAKVK